MEKKKESIAEYLERKRTERIDQLGTDFFGTTTFTDRSQPEVIIDHQQYLEQQLQHAEETLREHEINHRIYMKLHEERKNTLYAKVYSIKKQLQQDPSKTIDDFLLKNEEEI